MVSLTMIGVHIVETRFYHMEMFRETEHAKSLWLSVCYPIRFTFLNRAKSTWTRGHRREISLDILGHHNLSALASPTKPNMTSWQTFVLGLSHNGLPLSEKVQVLHRACQDKRKGFYVASKVQSVQLWALPRFVSIGHAVILIFQNSRNWKKISCDMCRSCLTHR